MSIKDTTAKKIVSFLQYLGSSATNVWQHVFIRETLPIEKKFKLYKFNYAALKNLSDTATAYSSSSTYSVGDICKYEDSETSGVYMCNTDITTAESWNASHWDEMDIDSMLANNIGYWDNSGIVAEVKTVESCTANVTNAYLFKSTVGDVEGLYTFTLANSSWTCSDLSGKSWTTTQFEQGVIGVTAVRQAETASFQVALTFDSTYTQGVEIEEVTDEMVGSVGIALSATKKEYDAAAYGQLRCTEQHSVAKDSEGKVTRNAGIVISCYGALPSVDIPCVLSEGFEFNRESTSPSSSN